MILKCERCGGSLIGDGCINCGWEPGYAKNPSIPTAAQPQVKPEEQGTPPHYKNVAEKQADIVTPQIADRPARFWRRWTPSELEYLANYYGLISDKHLAGQLHRTEDSIIKRARYERILQKSSFYTARTLAQVLGVPSPRTIIIWKKKGWLRGQRSGKSQSKNGLGLFTDYGVISCLKKRPWLVDLKSMEHHYFRTIIQEEWERNPWYTGPQASLLLGVGRTTLYNYICQGLLQVEKRPYLRSSHEETVIIRSSTIQAFLKQRGAIRSLTKSPAKG